MQHVAAHGSFILFAAGSSPGWSALPCCSALMQLLLSRGQHAIAGQQQQQQQLQQQQDTLPLDQQRRSTCESSSPQPSPAQALAACALPHLAQQSTTSQLTTWQQPLLYSQAMGLRTQAGRGTGSNHRRQQQQQQQQRQQEHRTQQHRPQQQQQQQQEQLRHQVAEPSAAELTALIMEADSPRELLQSVVANHQHINHIHIIAALNRATALWPTTATPSHPLTAPHTPRLSHIQPQQQQPSGDSKVQLVERQQLEVLMQQLSQPLVRALPRYSAREITSALWSYAQCGLRPPPEVLHECVNNVCSWDKLREAEPKHVVNLSWATSKLGCRDKQLFSYIAAVALSGQMQRYSPAQLSILSQAFTHAAYQDADLGRSLMDRTVQVLQEQLHLQQQQQQEQQQQQQGIISRAERRKAKHKGRSNWGFTPASLAGLIWSSAASGWLVQDPQVMQLSAAAALYDSFLDDIRPRAAANYVWAFASTLAGGSRTAGSTLDQQQHALEHISTPTDITTGSSSTSDVGVAASTAAAAAAASGPVAAGGVGEHAIDPGGVLDPGMVWEAALGVTAAALRRVDEADANNLARLLWSTATLADWVIRNVTEPSQAAAAAAAVPVVGAAAAAVVRRAGPLQAAAEGRVVFNQLCSALGSYWQQHPSSFTTSVVVTAWGLIAADKAGLWRAFTPPPAAAEQAADQLYAQQQQQPSPPTLLLQQLLRTTVSVLGTAKAGRQYAQLPAAAVADLSVAFAELKPRLEGYAVLWKHCNGPQQQRQQQEGGAGVMAQDSSTGGVEASSQQQGKEEEGSPLQLLSALSAAGEALAAAAWQHAGSPGALEVRDVSRMMTSFCTLQVDDNGLYHDLLQHWSQEALMGCSTKYLAGALYAAVVFARAKPELVQSGGLPTHTWQHLLSACGQRWGSFNAEEQRRMRGSVAKLMRTGLGDAVADELLQELAETVSVARNVNN